MGWGGWGPGSTTAGRSRAAGRSVTARRRGGRLGAGRSGGGVTRWWGGAGQSWAAGRWGWEVGGGVGQPTAGWGGTAAGRGGCRPIGEAGGGAAQQLSGEAGDKADRARAGPSKPGRAEASAQRISVGARAHQPWKPMTPAAVSELLALARKLPPPPGSALNDPHLCLTALTFL
ncbi:uncharacterized protein LOC133927621 [Phragmites australis]|uniref:uncharacterized protein LOC133927621 n=1 Tax=Phragmites australis TaxID=29695 RepID=UPI002D77BF6D|nr:uncharacterized protein LOC133927621 [Phragmites australis]